MKAPATLDELAALRSADTPTRIESMKHVMGALFGQPRPLHEVGDQLHLSKERIRQIERQALRHLAEGLLRKMPARA